MATEKGKEFRFQLSGDGISIDQTLSQAAARQIAGVVLGGSSPQLGAPLVSTAGVVDGYVVKWNLDTHRGEVRVRVVTMQAYQQSFEATLSPETPAEMNVLLHLLKHEKPVSIQTQTGELSAGTLPPPLD
jgi:hypothetical protein